MRYLLLDYLNFCTTVHDSNFEDGHVWGADNRETLRLVLYHEAAGIDGQVCVCGLYREHKVSIQRAGWSECQHAEKKTCRPVYI